MSGIVNNSVDIRYPCLHNSNENGLHTADPISLYNPSNSDDHLVQVPGMDNFNLSTPIDYNGPPNESFYFYHRLAGALFPGHYLAADFDLKQVVRYRNLDMSDFHFRLWN